MAPWEFHGREARTTERSWRNRRSIRLGHVVIITDYRREEREIDRERGREFPVKKKTPDRDCIYDVATETREINR